MAALLRSFVLAAACVSLLAASSASAADVSCHAACAKDIRRCVVDQARTALFACKLDCFEGSRAEKPSCLGRCAEGFRSDRALCREQLVSCNDICAGAEDDPSSAPDCVATCAQDLGTCGRAVVRDTGECVIGCADVPARLGLECLHGCVDTARANAVGCGDDFRDCVQLCSTTPP